MTRTIIFVVLWFIGFLGELSAEDRIVMRTAGGSRIGMPCIILDYTGREATYQTKPGGAARRLPRREILDVATHLTPAHAEGKDLLAKGQAREAFVRLDGALEQEQRVWVRREILALQIKCALWNGDRAAAGERFLAIFDSDPETLYFRLMPLAWSEDTPTPELARTARQWMSQQENAAAVLLGASHLLTLPDQAHSAVAALKTLARSANADIQRYAQIQLWRAKTLTEDVPRDELLRWERSFDDAGGDLGGGPRYILGLGWHRRHDDVAAAATWLWLPFVSGDDRWLAAQAAWNAGQALRRAGQHAEASAIVDEIARRYADTPYGPRAAAVNERSP
jgi:signal peptidase II